MLQRCLKVGDYSGLVFNAPAVFALPAVEDQGPDLLVTWLLVTWRIYQENNDNGSARRPMLVSHQM
jgi:hypothetical protein